LGLILSPKRAFVLFERVAQTAKIGSIWSRWLLYA